MSDDNGGWKRYVLMWDWHAIVSSGFPGWDKEPNNEPPCVNLSIVKGKDRSSRDLAIAFDDISCGNFYYRDFTDDNLPFADNGEMYRSSFWFQFRSDKEQFETF